MLPLFFSSTPNLPACLPSCFLCLPCSHLIQHPQVQHPKEKESHWLSQQCGPRSLSCSPESQQHYLEEVGGGGVLGQRWRFALTRQGASCIRQG